MPKHKFPSEIKREFDRFIEEIAGCTYPVKIRFKKKLTSMGTRCDGATIGTLDGSIIYADDNLSYSSFFDVIVHEYAHIADDLAVEEHSDHWGKMYAKFYRIANGE